jgi:hypothetical protein
MADFPGANPKKWAECLRYVMPYEKESDQIHLRDAVRKAGLGDLTWLYFSARSATTSSSHSFSSLPAVRDRRQRRYQ